MASLERSGCGEQSMRAMVQSMQSLQLMAQEQQEVRGCSMDAESQQIFVQLQGLCTQLSKKAEAQAQLDRQAAAGRPASGSSQPESMQEDTGDIGGEPAVPAPPAVVPGEAVAKMLQLLPTFQELMDTVGAARDAEKDEVFQAEVQRRLLAGLQAG